MYVVHVSYEASYICCIHRTWEWELEAYVLKCRTIRLYFFTRTSSFEGMTILIIHF